jgi:hypothetical protein
MKIVGARPDDSGFFSVEMAVDTPDGTYFKPDASTKIVIRIVSGWSLWRYLLVIVSTVLMPGTPRVTNLMLVGRGISRLTHFRGTQRLRFWATRRGVLMSGLGSSRWDERR